MASECNRILADGLWEKAQKLPEGANYRYALLIAARNIESHPLPIATDVDARKVKGVGPRIVKELSTMGLKASTSKRGRLFMEGADAVMPAKRIVEQMQIRSQRLPQSRGITLQLPMPFWILAARKDKASRQECELLLTI